MPERQQNWLDRLFGVIFGELAPFARTVFHDTTTYIFVAFCIFCARYAVARLFEPTDEIAGYLHVIDTYGTLLLLAGFVIWVTIDVILLVRRRIWHEGNGDKKREGDEDYK